VADEIQCGVGRAGSFLALEASGVEPDIVTLAKGLGGGFPIGAVLMTDEVAETMPVGGHGGTFGGNPLACSAALAVLEEIVETDLLEHVSMMGERLSKGLQSISSDKIRGIRGRGLMIGLELKEKVAWVIDKLRERGVFTMNAGSTVIRFVPPLTITEAEVDRVVEAVGGVLTE
jgi:acetylornithine/LysW-gamma-L-lysine aminotransferase